MTQAIASPLDAAASQIPDPLPAGGLDESRFDWTEVWYPVAYVQDLDRDRPTRFTLLEQDLVIWWDRTAAAWRVFADRCPHRLAPLSQGRIAADGRLECPYHGWAFAGDGHCDRIPQQPPEGQAETSRRACVRAYPTAIRQGLLFVYPGTADYSDRVPIPTVDALDDDSDEWVCLNTVRDLPYDALTLMENVLDASHIPYTHHKSVGDRRNAGPVELELVETGRQGFRGTWAEGPRRGTLGRQDTTFIAPGLMWHDLTSKQFGRTLTVVYATPIRKGECRIFARFPFKFSSKLPRLLIRLTPQWFSHIGQNAVLEDDQIFLHHQERYLARAGGSTVVAQAFYLPTAADAFVLALRRWVTDFNAESFPGQPLPPPRSDAALLDRYESHVKHCASCRGALHRIQRSRWVAGLVAAVAWTVVPVLAVTLGSLGPVLGGALVALGAIALWAGLGRLETRFYQGRAIPPRNQPDPRP
jgi:phenylpropionate dioxygenase-like ring-hydroxylating dioxygenase large terminal subunit